MHISVYFNLLSKVTNCLFNNSFHCVLAMFIGSKLMTALLLIFLLLSRSDTDSVPLTYVYAIQEKYLRQRARIAVNHEAKWEWK